MPPPLKAVVGDSESFRFDPRRKIATARLECNEGVRRSGLRY